MISPKLAIGDGALGFWKALAKEMASNGSTTLLGAQDGQRAEQGAEVGLVKDKGAMLTFYDFPSVHWQHIRTTNPIESVFATVHLRTTKTKNCGNRMTTLAMAWKLMETAQNKWRRLRGYKLLADVVEGVKFKDGERVEDHSQGAAKAAVHQI